MAQGYIFYELLNINEHEEQYRLSELTRNLRDAQDPFELPDKEFKANLRLNKEGALYLLNALSPHIEPGVRSTRIDSMRMVLSALQFMANGSYQRVVGNNVTSLLSQPMVSRSIKKITSLIISHLLPIWIRFPRNEAERNELKIGFRRQGMHDVIGLIDGTQIAITTPSEREGVYVNRKSYHSINVQIVCQSNLQIININSRYPGSCHDSYIWKNSRLANTMRANYLNNLRDTYILGDSGYPLQPWLLTPFANPQPNSPEASYNKAFVRVRSGVERCIGLLKGRFRCLLKDRVLHYKPCAASKIILSCAVLHNIAIKYNGNEDNIFVNEEVDMLPPLPPMQNNEYRQEGTMIRNEYVHNYFNI